MKCKSCGKDVTHHHVMCDEELDDDDVWCPECFETTPCGKGEHGEGCATLVFDDSPTTEESK